MEHLKASCKQPQSLLLAAVFLSQAAVAAVLRFSPVDVQQRPI